MAGIHSAPRQERIDWRGAALIATGMALSTLGFEQAASWGWGDLRTWGCIIGGLLILVVFVLVELRTPVPLIKVRIFKDRAFFVDNAVLFFSMVAFVPVFFFASVYSQVSLGYDASNAGLYLLVFFAGFAPGRPGRRQHPGQARRETGHRDGQRVGRGRIRAVGLEADRPEPGRPMVGHCASPAQVSVCCSGRPAPTRRTGRSTPPTGRSPASPRPSGTTAPRWVWRSWAPCWATSSPTG